MLAFVTAVTMGCQENEVDLEMNQATDRPVRRVQFSAGEIQTRTAFGEPDGTTYPTLWTENDTEVSISMNLETPVAASVIASANYTRASFSADFPVSAAGPYTFYVVSPATAVHSISASRKAWNIQIPAIQTPLPGSVSEDAQVIVAKSEAMDDIPETVDVQFEHLTAYGCMTLKNVDKALEANGFGGATILSVDITSEEAFAGSWYYHVEDGTMEQKDPSFTVTLKLSDVADASLMKDLWFSCLPVDVSEKTLTFRVNTDKGSVERSVVFPAGRSFSAGRIGKFSINMEQAKVATTTKKIGEVVYALVTSLDELEEDDDLIIVNTYSNPSYALGGDASTNNGISSVQKGSSNFTLGEDGYIRIPEGSGVSLMYVYSKSDSELSFVCGDYGALSLEESSRKYYLGWNESELTYWTVSINENGAATIYTEATSSSGLGGGSTSKYYIRYSNNHFNATTSTGTVALFKKTIVYHDEISVNEVADENDPILAFDEYGAYLTSAHQLYTPSRDQLSREYGYATVSFAILTPSTDQVLEFSGIPDGATKNDIFTLTVCRYEGKSVAYHEKFRVIVAKEEGPKLWLSCGDGQGFIVKK